jgi:YVTN family beta-propeller protein
VYGEQRVRKNRFTMNGLCSRESFIAVLLFAAACTIYAEEAPKYKVGIQHNGSIVLPDNQILTPAGSQVQFAGRPHAIAIRPDEKTAALSNDGGKGVIVIFDLQSGKVLQEFKPNPYPYSPPYSAYDGLIYSKDGSKLYASDDNALIDVMNVAADGTVTTAGQVYLPLDNFQSTPTVLAFSEDGSKLYVALNFDNELGVIDVQSQQLVAQIPVGNAPFGVVIDGNVAYVSNQGGRRATPNDFTNLSAGTPIVADPESGGPITGSVSIVDLVNQKEVQEIGVGLEPTAMVLRDSYLFVANTNSDTISVIDTRSQQVIKTISIQAFPDAPFGSSPNALAFTPDGELVVSLGANNALAVYRWDGPASPVTLLGLIPTGWYPGSLAYEAGRKRIDVANIKGIGSLGPEGTNGDDPKTNRTGKFDHSYLEKAFTAFNRSYPYNGGDSLVYAPTGFVWQNALKHGKTFRSYGEYAYQYNGPNNLYGNWTSWYNDSQILEGKATGTLHVPLGAFQARSDVPSLDAHLNRDYPPFDTEIPDQYRVDIFLADFAQYVQNGNLPDLTLLTICCDHTSGISTGFPTPQAQIADNDLALGRIVDAISHSRYWKDTAIFVVEDDSQAGVDHVDGHRAPAFVISPYAKRGVTDSTYYTQVDMVRTIEQILGLPPMNQRDLTASPMRHAFSDFPDFTSYNAVPSNIPFNELTQATASTS